MHFLLVAALATAPCCAYTLDRTESAVVGDWLKSQRNLRAAVDADSKCPDDIARMRQGTPGIDAVPDYHPYRVAADFNRDGERDVAIVVVHEGSGNFGLVVFNGPLAKGEEPAFEEGFGRDLACSGLFIGPPRPAPYELLVGPFESDNNRVLVPDGAGYRLVRGEVDLEAIEADQTFQAMPDPVRAKLLALFAGETPANPGAEFEATDMGGDPPLPHRRVTFWTQRNDTYFVYYEHGGYGYHSHLVGIRYGGGEARPVVNLLFFQRFASFEALQAGLANLDFQTPGIGDDERQEY
jgi:hypothetical protein